jgi:hypothetical protein
MDTETTTTLTGADDEAQQLEAGKTAEELAAEQKQGDTPVETDAAASFLADYIGEPVRPPKPAAAKPAKTPKVKTVKPAARPAEETSTAPDYDKIAAATAEGVARALTSRDEGKGGEGKGGGDEAEKLSSGDARRLKVLGQMAESWPDRYKDLPAKYRQNIAKLKEYADQWSKDHPGETFNEDDSEHEEFIGALEREVDYEDEDYTEALAEIKVSERMEGALRKADERIEQVELADKARQHEPVRQKVRVDAAITFWEGLNDMLPGVVNDKGQFDAERFKEIQQSDPETVTEAVAAAQAVEYLSDQVYLLKNGLTRYDPKSPAHAHLSEFAIQSEDAMMNRPEDKRLDAEGRMFLPADKYNKLPAKERDKHWTYSVDDFGALLAANLAKKTRERLQAEEERFLRRAKARGVQVDERASRTPRIKPALQTGEDEDGAGDKPISPTVGSTPKLAATRDKDRRGDKSAAERFISEYLG